MEYSTDKKVSNETADRIKFRVRTLVLLSSVSLAIVFSASFYFALLSNSTAIAKQIPELADVSDKMKGLLTLNVMIFAVVVIASFYLLSRIVTSRIFREIDEFDEVLLNIASNKLPERDAIEPGGAFEELGVSIKNVIGTLRDKEIRELEVLRKVQRDLQSTGPAFKELQKIINYKRDFLGLAGKGPKEEKRPEEVVQETN